MTTVDVPEEYIINVDAVGISYSEDNSGPFTFSSSRSRNKRDSFLPEVNEYTGDENNSLKIVFTNTAPPIVAPTGYGSYLWPLIWMLLLGMCLWTAMAYIRRRRSIEAFAMRNDD